jgi:hypothetical protein
MPRSSDGAGGGQSHHGATRAPPSALLDEETRRAFEADAKLGLLATVDPEGLPHLTLITSLQAKGPAELMFGQFCEGRSKKHVRENPRVAFLVPREGEDYELYNKKPMFRYNAYSGIHTIHYLDLVDVTPEEGVSRAGVVLGSLVMPLVRWAASEPEAERALSPWAERHLSKLGTLKFVCTVRENGYPSIVPLVPCRAAGSRRVAMATSVHRDELRAITPGTTMAIFAINSEMESVLVRGCLAGYRRVFGIDTAWLDVDWVYNSMPPKQGVIYPRESLEPMDAV